MWSRSIGHATVHNGEIMRIRKYKVHRRYAEMVFELDDGSEVLCKNCQLVIDTNVVEGLDSCEFKNIGEKDE